MRILHIIDSLELGGAEALTVSLATYQAGRGASVEIHCLYGRGGSLVEQARAANVSVVCHQALSPVRRAMRLVRAFRAGRPTHAVHCHNVAATVAAAPLARMAGVSRIVATRHGLASPRGAIRREVKFWMAARYSRARVVAVCDAARRELASGPGANPAQIELVYNGVHMPSVSTGVAPVDTSFVVTCVARLNRVKDHATLIHAVARARTQAPEIQLRIVGDGPEKAALIDLVDRLELSHAVAFLGERRDVGDCLRTSHLFALASITEGLPLSLLEAFAMGVPAVVSDVGGMPEVVNRAGAGSVVPVGDTEALSGQLVYWARNPERRAAAGRRARQTFDDAYRIDATFRAYDRLLGLGEAPP